MYMYMCCCSTAVLLCCCGAALLRCSWCSTNAACMPGTAGRTCTAVVQQHCRSCRTALVHACICYGTLWPYAWPCAHACLKFNYKPQPLASAVLLCCCAAGQLLALRMHMQLLGGCPAVREFEFCSSAVLQLYHGCPALQRAAVLLCCCCAWSAVMQLCYFAACNCAVLPRCCTVDVVLLHIGVLYVHVLLSCGTCRSVSAARCAP